METKDVFLSFSLLKDFVLEFHTVSENILKSNYDGLCGVGRLWMLVSIWYLSHCAFAETMTTSMENPVSPSLKVPVTARETRIIMN